MYARVTSVMVQPGKMDESVQTIQDSVVPVMKQQKGFKGYLLLTDSNTNKATAVTLWETEADMVTGENSGFYREQIAKIAKLIAGPPTTEHFAVRDQL